MNFNLNKAERLQYIIENFVTAVFLAGVIFLVIGVENQKEVNKTPKEKKLYRNFIISGSVFVSISSALIVYFFGKKFILWLIGSKK
jgi:hypothetical protein